MRTQLKAAPGAKPLIAGAFLAAGALLHCPALLGQDTPAGLSWERSPYRSFTAARPVLADSVLLFDESEEPTLAETVSGRLRVLAEELHGRQGWRIPVSASDPLRVYVARLASGGVAELAKAGFDGDRLVGAAIHLDASALSEEEAAARISRLYALAVLSAYRAQDRDGLAEAAASLLAGRVSREDAESLRVAAAAPEIDLFRHRRTLGRLYVEEFARVVGTAGLREAWERAGERGQDAHDSIAELWEETTGEPASTLFVRFAARIYTLEEPEAGPSRVSMEDLAAGALNAGATSPYAIRHRTLIPSDTGAMSVSWPQDGGPGAAVVRYRDTNLPADVVFFSPGESRTIPLSGVSRLDWVVAGGVETTGLPAPASIEPAAGYPFAGLSAQAGSGADGTRLMWTTTGHRGLAGWAVFREEVQADGRILRSGPEIVPATAEASESYGYAWVDVGGNPQTYRRYTVWAVTEEGLFARAFAVTLRAGE
jgi:hypothetical protein